MVFNTVKRTPLAASEVTSCHRVNIIGRNFRATQKNAYGVASAIACNIDPVLAIFSGFVSIRRRLHSAIIARSALVYGFSISFQSRAGELKDFAILLIILREAAIASLLSPFQTSNFKESQSLGAQLITSEAEYPPTA